MTYNFLNRQSGPCSPQKPILESRLLMRRSPLWQDDLQDSLQDSLNNIQPHTLEARVIHSVPPSDAFVPEGFSALEKNLPLATDLSDETRTIVDDTTWGELMPRIGLPKMSFPKVSVPKISVPEVAMPHIRIEISQSQKRALKNSSLTNIKEVQKNLRSTWKAGMRESLVDDNMKKNWASSLNMLKNTLADSLADSAKGAPTAADKIQGLDDIFPTPVSQITASDVGLTEDTFTRSIPACDTTSRSFTGQAADTACKPATFATQPELSVESASSASADPGFSPQMLIFLQGFFGQANTPVAPVAAEPVIISAPEVLTAEIPMETSVMEEAPKPNVAEIAAELLKSVSDELFLSKATEIIETSSEASEESLAVATPRKPVSIDPTEMDSDYVFQTILQNNRILNHSIASLADRYFENAAREEAENSFDYY